MANQQTVLGMRNTHNFGVGTSSNADYRPQNWRQVIQYMVPNGQTMLTGLSSMMKSKFTDDPQFNWWVENLNDIGADVTLWSTSDGATTNYITTWATGAPVDAVVYAKCGSTIESGLFTVGQIVTLALRNLPIVQVKAKVTAINAAIVTLKFLDADNAGTAAATGASANKYLGTLVNTCRMIIAGNANEQGAAAPESRTYDPLKLYNFTQIFRKSVTITRTAYETKYRNDYLGYVALKRQKLIQHGIDMELAFLDGTRRELTSGTHPETHTGGINWQLRTAGYGKSFWKDYGGASPVTWLSKGEEFLFNALEQLFRVTTGEAGTERLCFVGPLALKGIQDIAMNKVAGMSYNTSVETSTYGINVNRLTTPFGDLLMKIHPLYTKEDSARRRMTMLDPSMISYRYITDTKYKPDSFTSGGANNKDGLLEEWITEAGLQYLAPETGMVLDNVGLDIPANTSFV